MWKAWVTLLAFGTVVSAGACAAGTEAQGTPSGSTGTTTTQASGDDSGVSATEGQDAGSSQQLPPASDDSGSSQQTPPAQDSGTMSPTGVDSGGPVMSNDSGSTVVSEDSGSGVGGGICPATSTYQDEALAALAAAVLGFPVTTCTTGSDCSSSDCCVTAAGADVCVGL